MNWPTQQMTAARKESTCISPPTWVSPDDSCKLATRQLPCHLDGSNANVLVRNCRHLWGGEACCLTICRMSSGVLSASPFLACNMKLFFYHNAHWKLRKVCEELCVVYWLDTRSMDNSNCCGWTSSCTGHSCEKDTALTYLKNEAWRVNDGQVWAVGISAFERELSASQLHLKGKQQAQE